jgi:Zn-dependent protease with chaperone function
MTFGPANFFDGVTSARQEAVVELGQQSLQIRGAAGDQLAEWPYADIAIMSAPDGMLRLGLATGSSLARLEIRDAGLAAAFDARTGSIQRFATTDRRTRVKVVGWSVAAAVSAVLIAVFGVPAIVERVAPLVPVGMEQRLGVSVDAQVRTVLATEAKEFECGTSAATKDGRAAFDKMVRQLETAAALPLPLHAVVVHRNEANAFALPGGYVYVFEGIVDKAQSADELAGVIAHEMGHVAHRDGVRSVMQASGLSFLFGMLIGDFSGGGASVIAVRTVMQSSYSRETESAADAYGARLVAKLGRDPRALGAILLRIAGTPGPMSKILLDHPEAKDRAAAIDALAGPRPASSPVVKGGDGSIVKTGGSATAALISAAEWTALKRICATDTKADTKANTKPGDTKPSARSSPGPAARGSAEPTGRGK